MTNVPTGSRWNAPAREAMKTSPGRRIVASSLAHSYDSLLELRHAASTVAVVKATGETTAEKIKLATFTVSIVKVLRVLAGDPLPPAVGLRQLGSPNGPGITESVPVVSPDHVYLAYLTPFRWKRNEPPVPGQYVIVGAVQGLYVHAGDYPPADDTAPTFENTWPLITPLPRRISIAQAIES